MMRKMKLTAAEADRLLDDEEEDPGKVVWAIAGKILAPTPKVFHINTISAALKPAWGNPRGLVFRDGGSNIFIAELESERDRDRIWDRSPWTVSKFAVVLENFDHRSRPSELRFDKLLIWVRVIDLPYNKLNIPWGKKIASKIGQFVCLDVNKDGLVSAQYLRARVFINVKEPIMRWVGLDSARLGKTFWYNIQYEFLPYFCFSCGLLGHPVAWCPTPAERNEKDELQWGAWLRAPDDRKKMRGPPFAEGGYAEYFDFFESEGCEEEESDKKDPNSQYRNSNTRGRGRGWGQRGRGGRQSLVYRQVGAHGAGPMETAASFENNKDTDIVIRDAQLSGDKRDGDDSGKNGEASIPDSKKQRVAVNSSGAPNTSASAVVQPRRGQ
jgi:hypothetical protein